MKLLGIAFRDKNQAPMQTCDTSRISVTEGVEVDYRRKPGKRQVTLLSAVQWQKACDEIGLTIPWTTRRANLLVDEIEFNAHMVGKILQIGDVQLQICMQTDPCHRMDQQHLGLRKALEPDWRGGVCCIVIQSGEVRIGDPVSITP
ncbi:MOSC domain-containing protein [Aliiglaciecola sp. M165]|uniref:MOSC domain-containing protein n=1 Tax=Aliiglaciecola sp. M165 TaxID=2593649 RepID=UPI00117CCFB1|nr:MOSC domain-containing protein [Aliiglaciecola sp. M165]TRY30219.1 molybdenum cofactor biosysynthesis protein [Aliiglaciecola sp. M165]